MRRKLLLLPVLALAAGMSALAVPAGAQCRLCEVPNVTVSVSAAKSVVRLGSIHVEPVPRIASLE